MSPFWTALAIGLSGLFVYREFSPEARRRRKWKRIARRVELMLQSRPSLWYLYT